MELKLTPALDRFFSQATTHGLLDEVGTGRVHWMLVDHVPWGVAAGRGSAHGSALYEKFLGETPPCAWEPAHPGNPRP